MSDRAAPEAFGRADGPWASAPGVRSARSVPGRDGAPSRLYVDGKRLVIEDPDTGELNLPVAGVDQFAVHFTGDPSRIEVMVRIEVRGDGEPLDPDAVASHVDAVMRAWRGALPPPAPAITAGPPAGSADEHRRDRNEAPPPAVQSDVDSAPSAPVLRGPALVPDGPEWIMLGPMADTRSLALGELFANGSAEPRPA